MQTKGKGKEVQNIKVPMLKGDDLGKIKDEWKGPDKNCMPATNRAVQELVKVPLNEDSSRYF